MFAKRRAEPVRPIAGAVATLGVDERVAFIRRTYAHLAGAIGLFVLLSWGIVESGLGRDLTNWALGGSRWNWLLFMVLFMVVGWISDKWSRSDTSPGMQYLGLALAVVSWAFVMTPLLYVAQFYAIKWGGGEVKVVPVAALLTLVMFGGLTATVFLTKKDFSFLGGILRIGFLGSIGVIVASLIFGFHLGLLFAVVMVALASGSVLYTTSQVLAHYRPTQHVAASLRLFADIALLFYYILITLIELTNN